MPLISDMEESDYKQREMDALAMASGSQEEAESMASPLPMIEVTASSTPSAITQQELLKRPLSMEEDAPPDILLRKQSRKSTPHRSLKQLASVADKILHRVIVIEPNFPWEHRLHPLTEQRRQIRQARKEFGVMNRRVTVPPSTSPISSLLDEPEGVRSAASSSASDSTASSRSADAPARAPRERKKPPVLGPTQTRSPANMGRPLPADLEPSGIAERRQWYQHVSVRRTSSGLPGGFPRGGQPLDISEAPGSSLLTRGEFEVCSILRLYPLQFFEAREALVGNFHRQGFFKKSAAQKMVHIDVNKTGKLYDFFVSRGWMPAEPGMPTGDPPPVPWQLIYAKKNTL